MLIKLLKIVESQAKKINQVTRGWGFELLSTHPFFGKRTGPGYCHLTDDLSDDVYLMKLH